MHGSDKKPLTWVKPPGNPIYSKKDRLLIVPFKGLKSSSVLLRGFSHIRFIAKAFAVPFRVFS